MKNCNVKNKVKLNKDVYLYADFDTFPEIDDGVRARNSTRVFTGGIRINHSMYRTKQEQEQYIAESLKRKLP